MFRMGGGGNFTSIIFMPVTGLINIPCPVILKCLYFVHHLSTGCMTLTATHGQSQQKEMHPNWSAFHKFVWTDFFLLNPASWMRSNHLQKGHPNIARAGDIPVESDGMFQKLRRNAVNLFMKVPSLTFFNANFTVSTVFFVLFFSLIHLSSAGMVQFLYG